MIDSFTDIITDGWLERQAPQHWHPYMRLMRLDRPIGTWLLLLPGLWSIALAASFWHGLWLFILFAIGAVVMAGAGCVINDILDRKYDRMVERTAARPPRLWRGLARPGDFVPGRPSRGRSGDPAHPQPLRLLGRRAVAAAGHSLSADEADYPLAAIMAGLHLQLGRFAGLCRGDRHLSIKPILLYAGGVFWTLGYDTIYALQDIEDDAVVGVKSTALWFGSDTPLWLMRFYSAALALFALAGLVAGLRLVFILGILAAGAHLAWQVRTLRMDDPADCLAKFKSNQIFGLILLAAIILDRAL